MIRSVIAAAAVALAVGAAAAPNRPTTKSAIATPMSAVRRPLFGAIGVAESGAPTE